MRPIEPSEFASVIGFKPQVNFKAIGYTEEQWDLLMAQTKHASNMEAMPQVDALLAANWKIAWNDMSPTGNEVWQWKWRRPPRRKNSKGQLFWSTSMAFNALKREAAKNLLA